mgnify:CR=1 FL=1
MCGIVGYFGDAGNNLTRVLTAMSAITYRAPDSTGVGFFGDDTEPIRARKSLGAVAPLVETLLRDPAYPNPPEELCAVLVGSNEDPVDAQRRLLRFEDLPLDTLESLVCGEDTYITYEDLVNPEGPVTAHPGRPGRPTPLPEIQIRSRKHFQDVIRDLTTRYDLSPVVIRTLIRRALSEALERDHHAGILAVDSHDILEAFDRLFDKANLQERSPRPRRLYGGVQPGAPYAEKYLWRYLVKIPVRIPQDYDRDGVRCLFRLLDAALLSRLPASPSLSRTVQQTLENLWPEAKRMNGSANWRSLYWAEKGVNVFGRAAASVLAHLQVHEILPALDGSGTSNPQENRPTADGRTDFLSLRSLTPPLLSQGRWALQSPVTLKNAHPFLDHLGQRAIVLNGQFSGDVEENLGNFLDKVAGYTFRSRNSSEYFALLWGHYFDVLHGEKGRYETILSQIDQGLEAFGIGSRSIDYEIYRRLHKKSVPELDAFAFIEATRCLAQGGGQIAVSGMSVASPRTLYVASHNRPVFVVQRVGTQEFMVVSDVNAAMGLFPQRIIREKALELHRLWREHREEVASLRKGEATREDVMAAKKSREKEEERILETFRVRVYPLEGEETFARIEAVPTAGGPMRTLTITDFDGNPMPTVEPFQTLLNPLQTGKDVDRSFYETHLEEIPERFENTLNFHLPETENLPQFELRESLLRRRFGRNLTSLSRIVLLGMGSAHHAGIMSRRFIQRSLPGIDVVSLRPAELESLRQSIIPEKDLVLLLSWSGTTADMVRAAKDLAGINAAVIGVTEKVFSDVGLITARSVGVIPVLSGEEVTVPGLKSILCMMFSVALFSVWLSSRVMPWTDTDSLLSGLQDLPDLLGRIQQDESVLAFSKSLAAQSARARSALVIGALYTTGTEREAAFKLEETSWNAIGRSLDYREAVRPFLGQDPSRDLVLVNATNQARLPEAMQIMEDLSQADIPFAAVGFAGRHQADMERTSRGRNVLLPKVDDEIQPFIDLMFYYRFALDYGLAHGRSTEDFPRNRAKSVTAGRSPMRKGRTPAAEILAMEDSGAPIPSEVPGLPPLSEESAWELAACSEKEKAYYRGMRRLAQALLQGQGSEALFRSCKVHSNRMTEALFEQVPDEGEMLLAPLDRSAHSTARTLAVLWSRWLGCALRIATPEDLHVLFPQDVVTFFLGTRMSDSQDFGRLVEEAPSPCFYCGSELSESLGATLDSSLGHALLRKELNACSEEALYASLMHLFTAAWRRKNPERADTLERHIRQCGAAVHTVLNTPALRESISEAAQDNRSYATAFFIGPPGGTGTSWVHRFDDCPALAMGSYLFGESVHGPLVTVDSRVDQKFVRIEGRKRMKEAYGEDQVSAWEARFLGGETTDAFLARPPRDVPLAPKSPFYAEGNWYLPVLRPDYDTESDNLIILDATSDRYLGPILDEMATFGCRHARMLLLSQEAVEERPERRNLYRYPIGHVLRLPSLPSEGKAAPLTDLALPLVLNLLSAAMAAEMENRRLP